MFSKLSRRNTRMNLTSNKILKAFCVLLLCMGILLSTTACAKRTEELGNVNQICVSGAYTESWMNVYTDEEFIEKMVEFYDSIRYEETDKNVDTNTAGEVLSLTYSQGNNVKTKFMIDKNGVLAFEAGTECYEIVSDFDFEYIKGLVDEQREKVESKEYPMNDIVVSADELEEKDK